MNQNCQLSMMARFFLSSDSFFNFNLKLKLKLTQIGVFKLKACIVSDDKKNGGFLSRGAC
jgi:hypothetical protein